MNQSSLSSILDFSLCQQARLARDVRFDGKFYIAVKTTGIYCRPICPAPAPKEQNVSYYSTAFEAAQQGYRPCLRCRPDSAPGSAAWKGVDTTVERALKLIDEGALIEGSVTDLAERLGISDRYLRSLFQDKLGTSPKTYGLYQQLLFSKQLLHQTNLPITQVAYASGFNSLRRFNDGFKQHFQLTPNQLRKQNDLGSQSIELTLNYRPPYRWDLMQQFLQHRLVEGLEWIDGDSYGRSFSWGYGDDCATGAFVVTHLPDKHGFKVQLVIDEQSCLLAVVKNIRRILDLDTDISLIEQQLAEIELLRPLLVTGLRLPGIWSSFEAGIRAILGQQISVVAAKNLVTKLVDHYGQTIDVMGQQLKLFPSAERLAEVDFSLLGMPQSRRNTLMAFCRYCADNPLNHDLEQWLELKGIGPWTVNYAKMRGQSDSDVWLGSDLGVIKALRQLSDNEQHSCFDPQQAGPWRSYLTFQCWNLLS